jgi:hypothetical protein
MTVLRLISPSQSAENFQSTYPERRVGRGGTMVWPPRSPDLNPLNFFLWGSLEKVVYATAVNNMSDLQQQVANGCISFTILQGCFENVRQSLLLRAPSCVEVNGKHFEHLLQQHDCCHLSCRMCTRKIITLHEVTLFNFLALGGKVRICGPMFI